MKEVEISRLTKNPQVRFSNKSVVLPKELKEKIDNYWQSLLDDGKPYTRGEVFTITKKDYKKDGTLSVLVEKTDFAHYLYWQNIEQALGDFRIRIIFSACLIKTADDKIVFGKMGEQTARAGIYQCCGGGIDNEDLEEEMFNLELNISKELKEELGIDPGDESRVKDFSIAFLKQFGKDDKIAVIYQLELKETAEEFLKNYDLLVKELRQKDEEPEFGELIVLKRDIDSVNYFLAKYEKMCDDYLPPLLKFVAEK